MKKIAILLLFFGIYMHLFGCSLCILLTPSVHIYTKIQHTNNQVYLDIKWEMPQDFSNQTVLVYDQNQNNSLEKNELLAIKKSLEGYLQSNNYVTFLQTRSNSSIKYKIYNTKLIFDTQKKQLLYEYQIGFDRKLLDKFLGIEFIDTKHFFDFVLVELDGGNLDMQSIEKNKNNITLYFDKNGQTTNPPHHKSTSTPIGYLQELFAKINATIKTNMQSIKYENSFDSYIWLFCFAFLYGIVHAIGPGHGKSLVGAYFLSQKKSYQKAISISLAIGLVHTFSAFCLTFSIYFVLDTLLFTNFSNIEFITQKLSALIIIFIGIAMLQKKLAPFRSTKNMRFSLTPPQHTTTCGCKSCNNKSNDIGIIIAASIIPCPTTVTIFIFAMSLGVYGVGFIAAILMSLGMSLIIFASALMSIKLKKQILNPKITIMLEYLSLGLIIMLGLLLFLI